MSGRANGRNSLKKKTSNNTSNKLSLGNGLNINYVLMGVVGILVVTLIVKECQQKKEQFQEKKAGSTTDDAGTRQNRRGGRGRWIRRWVPAFIAIGIFLALTLIYYIFSGDYKRPRKQYKPLPFYVI